MNTNLMGGGGGGGDFHEFARADFLSQSGSEKSCERGSNTLGFEYYRGCEG